MDDDWLDTDWLDADWLDDWLDDAWAFLLYGVGHKLWLVLALIIMALAIVGIVVSLRGGGSLLDLLPG